MAKQTPLPNPSPQGGRETSADAAPEASLRRLPLVPLRDDVVFPKLIVPLSVGRRTSIAAITAAMDKDKQVLLVAQKDPQVDDTVEQDLYPIGTIAEINGMRQTPAGVQMLVAGAQRALRAVQTLHRSGDRNRRRPGRRGPRDGGPHAVGQEPVREIRGVRRGG